MKRLIIFLLLFAAIKVAGQTTGYLRFDTVMIYKVGGTAELVLMNKTKDSLGILTNYGNGRTRFIKSRALNDSTIVVGLDTLVIRGGVSGGGGIGSEGINVYNTDSILSSNRTVTQSGRWFRFRDGVDWTQLEGGKTTVQPDSVGGSFIFREIRPPFGGDANQGILSWYEGMGYSTQSPLRPNYPHVRGFNLSPGGGLVVAGMPAIGESYEPNFFPDPGSPHLRLMEAHKFYVTPQGVQRRLESYTIHTNDNLIQYYMTLNNWALRDTASQSWLASSKDIPNQTAQLFLTGDETGTGLAITADNISDVVNFQPANSLTTTALEANQWNMVSFPGNTFDATGFITVQHNGPFNIQRTSSQAILNFKSTSNTRGYILTDDADGYMHSWVQAGYGMRWSTDNSQKVALLPQGGLMINTTGLSDPNQHSRRFYVNGSIGAKIDSLPEFDYVNGRYLLAYDAASEQFGRFDYGDSATITDGIIGTYEGAGSIPDTIRIIGITAFGTPGQAIRVNATGDAMEWFDPTAGGGGDVTSVFGRTGAVVAVTNDYTWAQINKATSSLADITTRSAADLSSGTLLDVRLSANVPLLNAANVFSSTNQFTGIARFADGSAATPGIRFDETGMGIFSPDPDVIGIATNGVERFRITDQGNFGVGTVNVSNRFHVALEDAATNSNTNIARIDHYSSGTAAAGLSTGLAFGIENASGTMVNSGHIAYVAEDATASSEDAGISFNAIRAGSVTEIFRLNSLGRATFVFDGNQVFKRLTNSNNSYGWETQNSTGTQTSFWGHNTTSGLVSAGAAAGALLGLFANGAQVATITTGQNFGIGTTGPDRKLDVLTTGAPQIRATYTDGSVYTDIETASTGVLTLTPTGRTVRVPTGSTSNFARLGGVIWNSAANNTTSTTTETDLYTFTTPATTLGADGEWLEFEVDGSINPDATAGGATKTIRIYWAGTEVSAMTSTVTTANYFKAMVRVVRTSSSNARVTVTLLSGGVALGTANPVSGNVTTTFTNTNILKMTGQTTTTADLVAVNFGTMKWYPVGQ